MGGQLSLADGRPLATLYFLSPWRQISLFLAFLILAGCAEVTRPSPTVSEIEDCQLTALRRHPHKNWALERVSRVFLRELITVPQVHGRTYPFLGFSWWLTEADKIVVDNIWRPSPAHEVGLRQGDIILAVNNWPIDPWVVNWDRKMRVSRDVFRELFWVTDIRTYKLQGKSQQLLMSVLPGEILVSIMLDLKHIAMDARGGYLTGPVELLIERQGEKFMVVLYPQHLPADYAILVDTQDRQLTAYAAPGKIILARPLVNFCLNDDELALIVGHELAHHVLGHLARGAGQLGAAKSVGKVWNLLGAFATQTLNRLMNWRSFIWAEEDFPAVAQNAVVSVFSREDEREADAYGLWYAYQAGYDIEAGLALWERLGTVANDPFQRTYFLDSHPAPMERLARLKRIARYFKAGRAAEVFLPSADLDRLPAPE
jgi:Zn-dependent protease with chaperone function